MTISDIVSSIYIKTKTNSTSYPAADMLIGINNAYERVVSLIMQSDGRWEWDDNNQTDLPIATADLVSGQADYALAVSHLQIKRVELKLSNGVWMQLAPYDNADFEGMSITQLQTTTGIPIAYDVLGSSVFLYPVPNYSQSSSLKVFFERGPALYTSAEVTTGTKVPGFNSLYHDLIPLWVAYNFALDNGLPQAPGYFTEIQHKEEAMIADYSKRDSDDPNQLTMAAITFR